ncbi:MAG: hypothetical protein IKU86_09605 [Thermoguttaceae bacterium]|nr:hypothetical protein [Thermoguttaceae bacterium]
MNFSRFFAKNDRRRGLRRNFARWAGVAVAATALIYTASIFAAETEKDAIFKRAEAVAPLLEEGTTQVAKVGDREHWDKLAALSSGKQMIRYAENTLKQKSPELPEELYKEYYRNGNRSNYQREYGRLTRRISVFALAEALENKGRFVEALDATLVEFCALPSWVLPAHDRDAEVYDGKAIYSDLGATLAGAEAAIAVNLLRDKLKPETIATTISEIEKRILKPYEVSVLEKPNARMWWIRTENNWSAVCHAGTVAAALNVVESKERRAFFVAAADYFSETKFMKGFTNDGYCSEGLGYWNYGFGNYLLLGATIRNATGGKLDLFRFPKIPAILNYAPTIEIADGQFIAFADCSLAALPHSLYVGYLSRLKGYGYVGFEERGLGERFSLGDLLQTTAFGFDKSVVFAENSNANESDDKALPMRTDFPDAGVLICRPNPNATGKYFALGLKAGHNAELHNHNDVGSYSLILASKDAKPGTSVFVVRDPGGETYTARTFSARRYEGELLNSFGHPVPRIAGTLQKTGRDAQGKVVKEFSDELDRFEIDLTSAYSVETLASAKRVFEYRRANGANSGAVSVCDSVEFKSGEKGAFETAVVSFEKIEALETTQPSTTLRFNVGGATLTVEAEDGVGNALPLRFETKIVGENDASVPKKPTRLALIVDGDVEQATIRQTFSAQ